MAWFLEGRREPERYKRLESLVGIVRTAEDDMSTNAAEPIPPTDLIEICRCSSLRLFEFFKSNRNYNPKQFLASRQLDRARKRLIGVPQAMATTISLECGFDNHSLFSKANQEQFGEPPARSQDLHP